MLPADEPDRMVNIFCDGFVVAVYRLDCEHARLNSPPRVWEFSLLQPVLPISVVLTSSKDLHKPLAKVQATAKYLNVPGC